MWDIFFIFGFVIWFFGKVGLWLGVCKESNVFDLRFWFKVLNNFVGRDVLIFEVWIFFVEVLFYDCFLGGLIGEGNVLNLIF